MDRTACVDLSAFPLQLLLRRERGWKGLPVAVVAADEPQAPILWVNEEARRLRVLPGHRYAHALSLASQLRAGVVDPAAIAAATDEVAALLRDFSPHVEPSAAEPGVFWVDASGLELLYRTLHRWGRDVHAALRRARFAATVVVGFSRFATYALARHRRGGVTVFTDAERERAEARAVPLDRLDIGPRLRDALARLGVTTLGAFVRLPAGGVLERFGDQAHRLHRLAAGEAWDPLQPTPAPEPPHEKVLLDDAERDVHRLLFVVKGALDRLLDLLARQKRALAALHVALLMEPRRLGEPAPRRMDSIRPAEPTLDARVLLRLLHLRFEAAPPPAGVVEIELGAEDVAATREQLSLFRERPQRDLRAANEAFARLRATYGDDAVVRAVVRDGHLPEARYAWERLHEARFPSPRTPRRLLVRRVYASPLALPPQSRHVRDDGWLLRGLEHGPVVRILGPYIVSGGWWAGEVHREYHYAETRRGECLWVYYDKKRRRWYLQGQVE